ncbi:hypothetical protein LPBF_05200 [Flavobacterium crassostreae]|uniref:Cyclic nucleotide-binding domain-containing protein n=1 Tax=Flavobacterium crassostreae TaxID=1763534 RepID=A0A1B9E674_9FLAO|nr:hypothetical protein LPBF_05200 [Flavobacterium crassostreae]
MLFNKYPDFWYPKKIGARKIILKEGDVSKKLYFINKGCVRLWTYNNGAEITIQFFFENDLVCSIESFLKNKPSVFYLETIEDCDLIVIKKSNWKIVLKENPQYKEMSFEFVTQRMFNYFNHFLSYIQDNPEERYRKLLKDKPHIIQRVPLQYIATYLGITTVSLSRIRARLK